MNLTDMATSLTFDALCAEWLENGAETIGIRRIWRAMYLSRPDETGSDDFQAQAIARDWEERATGYLHADDGLPPSPEMSAYRADVVRRLSADINPWIETISK